MANAGLTHPPTQAPVSALLGDILVQLNNRWTEWFPGTRQPRSLSYVIQGTGVGKLIIFVMVDGEARPTCVVKIPRSRRDNASLAHEHDLVRHLRRLGGQLTQATLPEPVAALVIQDWQVVVERMLPGSLLSAMVPVGKHLDLHRAGQHLRAIREWLVAAQKAVHPLSAPIGPDDVDGFFAQPIERAQRDMDWNERERQHLDVAKDAARGLIGKLLPISFVHGDLRPGNILDWHGQLRVIDWQFGQLRALPMLDWFEFAYRYYCDAIDLAEITGDHDSYGTAFDNVFMGAHPYSQLLTEETATYMRHAGVPQEYLDLFLTMWLVDNSNKYRRFLDDRAERGYLYLMQNPPGGAQRSFSQQLRRQVYPSLLGHWVQNGGAAPLNGASAGRAQVAQLERWGGSRP